MVETGQCLRVKGGVIAPTAAVDDPLRSAMLEQNLINLKRLYRNLRKAPPAWRPPPLDRRP